ncbi:MAG: carbon-nitrogen hydrolase family protein [Succinivibrio sp.]
MPKIVNIQFQSILGDYKANLDNLKRMLNETDMLNCDLIVVPEFFASSINYVDMAPGMDGGCIIDEMKKIACRYHSNVIAGSVVRKNTKERLYNSSFAIDRCGNVLKVYDKIHLFNYLGGTEGERITSGREICTVNFDFGKTAIAICFDITSPLMFHTFLSLDVKLIVLPTAWIFPASLLSDANVRLEKEMMWQSLAKTRAYDSQAFFVVCNQVGDIGRDMEGLGCSMIVSPYGEIIKKAGSKNPEVLCASLDFTEADRCKSEFPKALVL